MKNKDTPDKDVQTKKKSGLRENVEAIAVIRIPALVARGHVEYLVEMEVPAINPHSNALSTTRPCQTQAGRAHRSLRIWLPHAVQLKSKGGIFGAAVGFLPPFLPLEGARLADADMLQQTHKRA